MRPSQRLIQWVTAWFMIAVLTAGLAIAEQAFESLPKLSDFGMTLWFWSGMGLLALLLIDLFSLRGAGNIRATRKVTNNLAVGAATDVTLRVDNPCGKHHQIMINDHYPRHAEVKDLPQTVNIDDNAYAEIFYKLKVLHRGDAEFGKIRMLVSSSLKYWQRVVESEQPQTIKVYPNFAAIHDYILLSADQQTSQMGIRLSQRRGD